MTPVASSHAPVRLQFDGLQKSFFGVPVLRSVSFSVRAGAITALVGENGAGKSTLMNLLGGNLTPDAGQMLLEGQPHQPRTPAEAQRAGIAFVHQELNLFGNLSVAENLCLDGFPLQGSPEPSASSGLGWINRPALQLQAKNRLDRVCLKLDPNTPLHRLSSGERQLVEIAKALGRHPRVLILDEPTTSLSAPECSRLFALMRELRSEGLALIFISHSLSDVLREADDLVILRDGAVVAQGPCRDFSSQQLITHMVGRTLEQLFPPRDSKRSLRQDLPCLEVRNVTQPGIVRDISFTLHSGEILGMAGLMGAGRSELARILFGLDPHASGEIRIGGELARPGPRGRIQQGVGFLTEDRRGDGLCLESSIADNMTLVSLPQLARTAIGWLDPTTLRQTVQTIRESVRLTATARDEQPVKTLSGGNQQKVVLAKWLLTRPKVLILDEPTRGIDVGAKYEIYQLIHQLADQGAGILVISSEIEELLGLCDRLLVLAKGQIRAELPRAEFQQERILAAALPA